MEKADFDLGGLSDFSDTEIDRAISEVQPPNTVKQTRWGMQKFEDWLKRRPSISVDFKQDSEDHLALVLRKFYMEVGILNFQCTIPVHYWTLKIHVGYFEVIYLILWYFNF